MKYKILIDEYISVMTNTTLVVDTDKELEKMTPEEIVDVLENDENTVYDIENEDFDWTTEQHEGWGTGETAVHVIEKDGENVLDSYLQQH